MPPSSARIASVFDFDYRLVGAGWAEGRIADDDGGCTITASYLSDALGNLLEAVVAVLQGAAESRCSWDEEPGEYRWVFACTGSELRLRILAFDELWGEKPDSDGQVLFATVQSPVAIGAAVLATATALLKEHGLEGYREKWVEFDFPSEALARLESVVRRLRANG